MNKTNSNSINNSTQTHHAILIGVGITANPNYRPVKGAIEDIRSLCSFFEPQPHVRVTKLTATAPENGDTANIPVERPQDRSSFKNVRAVLDEVIREGERGQTKHVYIHFSGHGSRTPKQGFLLVLFDGYLRATDLSKKYLAPMTKQGMHVTVVLDCCFSANFQRNGELDGRDVRFMEYDSSFDLESSADRPDLSHETSPNGSRGAKLAVESVLDAKTYTVFTACGITESAGEIEFPGTRMGALSYFFVHALQSLSNAGTQISYDALYQHLLSRFHARIPQQNPIRYGKSHDSFFRELMGGDGMPLVPLIFNKSDNVMILGAGEAHGVCKRDEYEAYRFYASEDGREVLDKDPIRFRVGTVSNLTSELILVGESRKQCFGDAVSWKAKPLTSFSPRKTRVRLMPCVPDQDREQLLRESERHPFLQLSTGEEGAEPSVFGVMLQSQVDGYKILDGAARAIPNLPTTPRGSNEALHTLARRLGHLARFKFLEALENQRPDGQFEKSFLLRVDAQLGQDGWYEVEDQHMWKLECENLGDKPLYAAIFQFGSQWDVSNILSDAGEGCYREVSPSGSQQSKCSFEIQMQALKSHADGACREADEDVIKIFITNKTATFHGMVLPELLKSDSQRGHDHLSNSVEGIIGFDGTRDHSGPEKWATRNFLVRTTVNETMHS